MLAKNDALHPASLMNALAENERIRSVRDGLAEGISGLRLYIGKPSKPEFGAESKRGLTILQDFCQYFITSVEFEKAVAEQNRKILPKLEQTILKDVPLYTGIVSTLSNEEREKEYGEIKEIHEFLNSGIESKTTGKEPDKYIKTLVRLYKVIEERTTAKQHTTECIILGHNGHI